VGLVGGGGGVGVGGGVGLDGVCFCGVWGGCWGGGGGKERGERASAWGRNRRTVRKDRHHLRSTPKTKADLVAIELEKSMIKGE